MTRICRTGDRFSVACPGGEAAVATLLLIAAAFAPAASAQTIQGNLDTVDSNACRVAGWARDPQVTDPIQVVVYADGDSGSGTLVSTLTANILRTDLPYTDQNHGFSQVLPLIDG